MKVVVAGDFFSKIYEQAIFNGFVKLGHDVKSFGWGKYFKFLHHSGKIGSLNDISLLFQNKFKIGPVLNRINFDLINFIEVERPELLFIYRGTHIYKRTIEKIKKTGTKVFGYNNDDPFSHEYPFYFWRHFNSAIHSYDYIFAYRTKNIIDYKEMGYKNVSLLRSYYLQDCNYKISEDSLVAEKYKNDVIFIGHFEDDGRDYILKFLIEEGINVKIYGTNWQSSSIYSFFQEYIGDIYPVYDDYNEVINGAKIALVFLSKLNQDSYTRRCFEIPAAETLMISEYTDDLNSLFLEGYEADYFRNKQELLTKIKLYLNNPLLLKKVSTGGKLKLLEAGHELTDRVKQVIEVYETLK